MEGDQLTEAQQCAVDLLHKHIRLDPKKICRRCPLDYGRHSLAPKKSLGTLEALPAELLCQILEHVNVLSILKFRRVNQKAMSTVDALPEFKKVMINAPNAVRVAIDIQTAHTFTIKQLYAKLCQQQCELGCGKPAPYLDVFKLRRTCLWVGGACDTSPGPKSIPELSSTVRKLAVSPELPNKSQDGQTRSHPVKKSHKTSLYDTSKLIHASCLPSFLAHEMTSKTPELGLPSTEDPEMSGRRSRSHHFDYQQATDILTSNGYMRKAPKPNRLPNRTWNRMLIRMPVGRDVMDEAWKMTAVFAPWLTDKGMGAMYGSFCETCLELEKRRCDENNKQGRQFGIFLTQRPSPENIAFGCSEWLERHREEKHRE